MFNFVDLSCMSPNAPGIAVGASVAPDAGYAATANQDLSNQEGIWVTLKTQGATGGTIDIYLQTWDGVDWIDWAHLPTIAAGAAVSSTTFVPHIPAVPQFITTGRNLTPAMTAGNATGGPSSDRMRVLFVAGAGTTAGAMQTIRVCSQSHRENG